ncbi:glycoside hydrolase family 2 TIM barrel-domain containing protein [Algibacillus agarilyticus]|uniref:glycoside hydrolase family 2 TIM barrel-domain containing protein n=1 Tax=Algibacillus agarilyticus TaxID=2234133 RepID=UPI000DCFDE53|nr:glycoside hydrolase family 2 TIM barrel-domain containing protein [Algibacillus agarilyticus]
MRGLIFFTFISVLSTVIFTGCSQSTSSSSTQINVAPSEITLSADWQFQKTAGKSTIQKPTDAPWQTVDLPHTPKVEPLLVNDQWQGIAFYRKQLNLSNFGDNQKLYLRFEGAMKVADVWLNGVHLGQHVGGYLPFTFDVTPFSGDKQADLLVRLDNQDNWLTGPKPLEMLDFNTYGGLYREVKLIVKNGLHITDEMEVGEVASGGIFVTTPVVGATSATVNIKTHIENANDKPLSFGVKQTLLFADKLVAQTTGQFKLSANKAEQFEQTLTVVNPKLWHPNHPHLYTVTTDIINGKDKVDSQQTRIGIREFKFDENHQLLINGEPMFLRGVNRHQEYPHVGYATSPEADYRDAVKIKSAGFDYVRLSHYPHSKAFMEAADELGLVLIDAILGWQYYSPFPAFKAQIYQTCHDLIRRDRNHASVLAWECSLNESWMPDDFIAGLDNIIEQELPGSYSAGWQRGYDIYLQARQHRLEHFEEPNQPYNVSEYGDWEYYAQNAGLNQDSWADLKSEERTSRQLLGAGEKRLLQQATNIQEAHNDNLKTPAYSDGFWAMFDYNRGYADDLEASGIASIYRVPKFAYYFYQSQRSPAIQSNAYESGPMVYIASDWTAQSNSNVRVFTNAEQVELWLNGKKVSTKKPVKEANSSELAHPPIQFELGRFAPGELVAKAYINNQLVAEHKLYTPTETRQIKLTVDESGKAIAANDVVFVYAQLVDVNGHPTYDNNVEIEFEISGENRQAISLLNPEKILTEKGIATALIKTNTDFKGAMITAHVKLASDTEQSHVVSQQLTF